MKKISILTVFLLVLCSCSTAFKNPIKYNSINDKSPIIRVVQQGSIPASSLYRPVFIIVTNQTMSRDFVIAPEIIAAMIQQILSTTSQVSQNYYDTLKVNYRYRNDYFIYNYPNLSDKQIEVIIENFTKPQLDAQRSAVIR